MVYIVEKEGMVYNKKFKTKKEAKEFAKMWWPYRKTTIKKQSTPRRTPRRTSNADKFNKSISSNLKAFNQGLKAHGSPSSLTSSLKSSDSTLKRTRKKTKGRI